MATRLYSINPGQKDINTPVTQAVGSAVVTKGIELTVDLSTAYDFNGAGSAKAMTKQDVLDALDQLKEHIEKRQWPPA